jgi:hypothetical protein
MEDTLGDALAQNMSLTNQLIESLAQNDELTKSVEDLARQIHGVVCAVAPGAA